MSSHKAFVLVALLGAPMALTPLYLAGCGSDDDPAPDGGDADAAGSGTSPNLSPKERCETVLWESPSTDRSVYSCVESSAGGWSCDCDGSSASDDAAQCAAAIVSACGISEPARGFCETGPLATCWPADGGDEAWTCRCGGEDASLLDATGADCGAAMDSACGSACEDEALGACVEDAAGDGYRCACSYYAPALRTVRGDSSCEDAMQTGCTSNDAEPGAHGCNSLLGFCDADGDDLDCTCLDGTTAALSSADLAGTDCPTALGETCGTALNYNDTFCSGDQGECRRGNADGGPVCYECLCRTAGGGQCVEAVDCWEALAAECEAG